MSRSMEDWLLRRRLTVADYHRMADAGVLAPDARVELIEGQIIDMAPIGSLHAAVVTRLGHLLSQAVGASGIVRVQQPLRLGDQSQPEPDLTLVGPRPDY